MTFGATPGNNRDSTHVDENRLNTAQHHAARRLRPGAGHAAVSGRNA